MPQDPKDGRGRWKAARAAKSSPGRKQARKWTAAAVLGALLGAAVLGVVLLFLVFVDWFRPKTAYAPFWVGAYDRPGIAPVAWIGADRRAVRDGEYFHRVEETGFDDPNLGVLTVGLDSLADRKADEAVVVHFLGSAVVCEKGDDADGPVRIIARDSNPGDPGTMLPLRTILDRFTRCPARKKLLILDVMRPRLDLADLGGMGTADGVSDLVRGEIEQVLGRDDGSGGKNQGLILTACAAGQSAVEIDSLGGSLFNRSFRAALEDPVADADGNGRITVKELAAYVARAVDRDAFHYRGLHQTPELYVRGPDFVLAPVGVGRRAQPDLDSASKRPIATDAPEKAAGGEAEAQPKTEAAKQDESKNKEKEEKKEKTPAEGGGKGAPAKENSDPHGYPPWLAAGWNDLEALRDSGVWFDSPRPFRALEAGVLRAEQRWRGGGDPATIQSEIEKIRDEVSRELARVRKADWLIPRSVGQARALGWRPDEGLIAELKGVFRQRREPDPFSKKDQQAEALTAVVKAFLARLKGKPILDLGGAMVEVLSSVDERFNAETVRFADSLVDQAVQADASLRRDLIELRFLGLLAQRSEAAGGEPWSEESARRAWECTIAAEQADCRPWSIAWVARHLDQADSLRHQAETLILPRTAGFASWKQIDAAWEESRLAYGFVANAQRRIEAALETLARSAAFLPTVIPYLESIHQPELERVWHEAAVQTRTLGDRLAPPSAAPSREELQRLNDDLTATAGRVDELLKTLAEPFSPRSLESLMQASRDERERPNPELAARIYAILAAPISKAPERQALWNAIRDLDRRLERELPATPLDSAVAGARSARTAAERTERVTARAGRLADLVRIAGDAATADDMAAVARRALASSPSTDAGSVLTTWKLMAVRCANVRRDLKKLLDRSGPEDDLASWIAPVDALDWRDHLVRDGRSRSEQAVRAWLGSRYRHEKEDARDLETVGFYRQAEGEVMHGASPGRDVYPELSSAAASESGLVKLSTDHAQAEVAFQVVLRAPAEVGTKKITIQALQPGDPRLKATLLGESEIEAAPQTPRTARVRVEWVEDGIRPAGFAAAPRGFIIQARTGDDRTYHLPIPLAIVPESDRIQLALSADPARLDETPFDLRLRAVPGRRRFFVFIKNPSPRPRDLLVEILEGGSVVPGTEAKPMAVAAGSTVKVPAFGAAPIPPTDPLHPLPDPPADQVRDHPPLQIRLKDAATGEVLQLQRLTVGIASPRDYLEDAGARFTPSRPGESNRLELRFRARPALSGPPAALKMTIDKKWIPSLLGTPKELKLEGALEPGGTVSLYAGGIPLDARESSVGLIPVDVDGLRRAFWFQTHFELAEGPQRAELISKPRIYFEAAPILKPNEPARLKVAFQVDDPPPDARLRWRLGRVVDDVLKDDVSPFEKPAKDRRIAFDARGADGALLFEASVRDWEPELVTANIRGERRLQAVLLGPDGRTELANYAVDMILDDRAPSEIALALPREVKPKGVLKASAVVTPPAAGLKEVFFYYGKGNPDDFKKAEAENKLYRGEQQTPGDSRSPWEAALPVPDAAGGVLVVGVRALSNVGLVGFATGETGVVAPKSVDEEAKAAMPKLGSIVGKVTEGDRPQPGLVVELFNLAPKAGADPKAAEVESGKDGTYAFPDLEPGPYAVRCIKAASTTADVERTILKAGETKTLNLELVR